MSTNSGNIYLASSCLTLLFNIGLLSTELQLKYISPSDIWVLTLNKNTLADSFEGGLNQNFLKWPILVGQLPSCVNIPRFILWVLKCLQRSNCCKKMNTWNLTLLSFIDSGWKDELFQMLQYFGALGALQHLGCSLCHQYLSFVLFWLQKIQKALSGIGWKSLGRAILRATSVLLIESRPLKKKKIHQKPQVYTMIKMTGEAPTKGNQECS